MTISKPNPQNILSISKSQLNGVFQGFGDAIFEFAIKNDFGNIILHNDGIHHLMNSPMIPNYKQNLLQFVQYLNAHGFTCCQVTRDLDN